MGAIQTRESIDEICSGFLKARILLTAAEIDLFTILKDSPKSAREICESNGFNERGLTILMDALVSMGLLNKHAHDIYNVDDSICLLLCKDSPDSFLPMVLHRARMWNTWSNLTEIVKTGAGLSFLEKKKRSQQDMEAFIGAMHAIGAKKAETLADKLDLGRFRKMIDVGGASGTYIIGFLRKNRNLRATLFDLPEVIPMARRRIESEGLSERVDLIAGDYNVDQFPPDHDLALLSAVIHINSREANRSLYSRLFQSLQPAAAILIRDFIMDDSRTSPADGAIFAVNMLVATKAGNSYTFKEVCEDLIVSGFVNPQLVCDGLKMDQVIMAKRP